jgi:hypothetical protein
MQMMEINGSSAVFEIPVHFRYSVVTKNKFNFIASAGFSSYFMTAEKNEYHTMYNGTASKMMGDYRNNQGYFAASIDISLACERMISKKVHVRFEPYLQLPIRELGVGKLPVKTAGIRVGIFHSSQ